jgi:hypothetical protein
MKLLLSEEGNHILCAMDGGKIDLVNVHDWKVEDFFDLGLDFNILDIAKLSNPR